MTANECFILFKKLYDEINAAEIPHERYMHFQLKDERKLKIYQDLIDTGVDIRKFFLANCTLNREFFIEFYKYNPDKCMALYHSWDEFIQKKRPEYFRRVLGEAKKGIKLDLEDRDSFLELIQTADHLFLSALYPDILELLLSMDEDWFKFHMPDYKSRMDFIRRVIRGHFILKEMKNYDLLRKRVSYCINNK